jgi:UPF0755 protein
MKNAIKALLGVFVHGLTIAVIAFTIGLWTLSHDFHTPSNTTGSELFTVKRGMGLSTIGDALETNGLISNALTFKIGAFVIGAQRDLKAGEYDIPAGASIKSIIKQLRQGDIVLRQYTLREGLTSYEITRRLNTVEGMTGDIKAIPPEGSLLPNTYSYELNDSRADHIIRMKNGMTAMMNELWQDRADNLPITTKKEALILASIIEKETGKPGEHARVAGVFINRLRIGMPLQTDPTVIYAITKGKHKNEGKGPLGRRLLRKDLEYKSPYNTYLNAGLPPGPIANPGRAALEAALNPESHDYLYFVADGTGGHVFGKTLAEHNRNAAKWRKIRRAQSR